MDQGARHIRAIILKFSKTSSVLHVQISCHVSLLIVSPLRPPRWGINGWQRIAFVYYILMDLMGGTFFDAHYLAFSSTMMLIAMPSHTYGKMKAPTLPILANGQQLLFTSSLHGALQELQVAARPCSVSPDAVCSSHDESRALDDLNVSGSTEGLAQRLFEGFPGEALNLPKS
jgi:hypothetical protein